MAEDPRACVNRHRFSKPNLGDLFVALATLCFACWDGLFPRFSWRTSCFQCPLRGALVHSFAVRYCECLATGCPANNTLGSMMAMGTPSQCHTARLHLTRSNTTLLHGHSRQLCRSIFSIHFTSWFDRYNNKYRSKGYFSMMFQGTQKSRPIPCAWWLCKSYKIFIYPLRIRQLVALTQTSTASLRLCPHTGHLTSNVRSGALVCRKQAAVEADVVKKFT